MVKRKPNVLTEVVAKSLCCGCGVCAGVGRAGCLAMRLGQAGEYVPAQQAECTGCGLCLEVCPFFVKKALQPDDPLGPVMGIHVGWSAVVGERERAASGGLVTRTLRALLDRGYVDRVVVVGDTGDPETWFAPTVTADREVIQAAAGSKYAPVEFSGAIRAMLAGEGRYAVVALPCVISAMRLAAARVEALGRRLRYLFALTCGHNNTRQYTRFLAAKAGVSGPLRRAVYRLKGNRNAGAFGYGFQAEAADGRLSSVVPFTGLPSFLWDRCFFTWNCCFYCADVFGYEADATFMDAWLPEYYREPAGTSIVVTRSEEMRQLLEQEIAEGRVVAEPLPREAVLRAQAGAIRHKHQTVGALLAAGDRVAHSLYDWVPSAQPRAADREVLRAFRSHRRYAAWSRWLGRGYGTPLGWLSHRMLELLVDWVRFREHTEQRLKGRLRQVRHGFRALTRRLERSR